MSGALKQQPVSRQSDGRGQKKETRGRKGRAEEITESVIVRGGSQGTEQRGVSHGGLKMSRAAGPAGSCRTRRARRNVP